MKKILVFAMMSILLSNCTLFNAPIFSPATNTATLTLTPTSSPTPKPTSTSTPTQIPPLQIALDYTNPKKIPFITWDYLTSPKFVDDLYFMEKWGMLAKIPNTAIPVTEKDTIVYMPDDHPDTAVAKKYGIDYLMNEAWPAPYGKLENRPWMVIGIWKTDFNGDTLDIIVLKWKNWDESHGFIGYITALSQLEDAQSRFTDNFYNPNIKPEVGAYFNKMSPKYGCGYYFSSLKAVKEFCGWYFENPNYTLAPQIFRNWKKTGLLQNEITDSNGAKIHFLPLIPFMRSRFGATAN